MQEKENILRILKEALKSFKKEDSNNLKNLSNQTIHSATISQDLDNILVAVIIYSIGKILERKNYKEMDGWNFFHKETYIHLKEAFKAVKNNNIEYFRISLGKIRELINNIDSNLREYIKDIFYKAQINKASKIYQHGVSVQKAAELLGVSLWDLSSYIGQTIINEADVPDSLSFERREKILEEFLR